MEATWGNTESELGVGHGAISLAVLSREVRPIDARLDFTGGSSLGLEREEVRMLVRSDRGFLLVPLLLLSVLASGVPLLLSFSASIVSHHFRVRTWKNVHQVRKSPC